jgi:hypothetical protein
MFFSKSVASVALAALLCSSTVTAAIDPDVPHIRARHSRRDGSTPNTDPENPPAPALLEPVIPPEVNEDALSVLALDKTVKLAWAGSTDGVKNRRVKRETAVLSQANFEFAYPAVALDHSAFVTSVTCSGGKITATMTSAAYTYAKKNWPAKGDLLFVTASDGCGLKDANEYFHAKSITFSDATKTFTATGAPAKYKDVAVHMNLKWGDAGSYKLKRAVDRRHVSHSSTTALDVS